ncbi:MAG: SH3 domain-containing protein [Desulfobacterales bacterium]|nr:SH3 domain-containing protein [Desulfobacterales bacterium]
MKKALIFTLLTLMAWVGTASAKRLSVAVDKANVRSGPGTNHETLWSVGKYYPVDIIKKSGNWYRVRDFEGDIGWIHRRLLKEIRAVIVKSNIVNVRERPGTGFKVLFQAEKGVSFKVLKRKKRWLKVRHADGDAGWIYKPLVWGY